MIKNSITMALALMALPAMPAVAEDKPPTLSQMRPSASTSVADICRMYEQLAQSVMNMRQSGVIAMSEARSILMEHMAVDEDVWGNMLIEAFDTTAMETEQMKLRSINEFATKHAAACFKLFSE
ncbi:MAG: hypothetical protein EON61_02535 [Alphaproteobacteria bacterium]|nr:MAG: hypothetical protein EON61_02535 [Alphaproteobacteria bacterium]